MATHCAIPVSSASCTPLTEVRIDPILAAILGKKMEAIAREMAAVLERTARSPLFQVRDFCTVVLDGEQRILSQEEGLPQMAYAVSYSLKHVADFFGDDIKPGDVFVHNDPYYGGNQAQDTAIMRPIFLEGQLRFWAAAKGHLADLGSAVLGGYNPDATDIWQENFRIPPLRLYRDDAPLRDVWNMLVANTRLPQLVGGDLQAQIGATKVAEGRLVELCESYTVETLEGHLDFLLDATEQRMRAEIARIPEGVYHGESVYEHEEDGGIEAHTARLTVTVRDAKVTLDFDGTDPQCRKYYNGVFGTTFSAVIAVFLMLVDPDLPHNDGVLRCIDVRVPEGTFLNASFPAPCVQGNFTCQDVAAEALFRALAEPLPEAVTAGWNRGESHNIRGIDPRSGGVFFDVPLIANKGGAGGTFGADGWDNIGLIACGGGYAAQDYEIFEAQSPVRVVNHEYRSDSGGPGEFRGGMGIEFHYRIASPESTLTVYGEDRDEPFGLFGGETGAANIVYIREAAEEPWERMPPNQVRELGDGAEIRALNAGGGGYGPAHRRSVDSVAADVRKGFVSAESAAASYGVIVSQESQGVDQDSTRERRRVLNEGITGETS
jgi:N-methylhydantoinase B